MVAAGLEWQPGDNVVIAEADFSANVYPWLALERQGVRVKRIPARLDRAISVADVAEQLDDRTKLVALSAVHFVTGAALDVDAVGAFLKARGVLFCVDAIQAFGAVPVSARNVDFLAADGHKWLLGPQGLGVLVVRRPAMAHLRPVLPGWRSVPEPGKYYAGPLQWADSARRYEPGSLNAVGVVGLHAALQLLTDLGPAAIARHLRLLRAHLVDGLRERGYRIVGPAAGPLPSGIVAFAQEAPGPMAPIYQRLDAQGTVVSLRQTWRGEEVLRVAPHGYTTAAEVRRFLEQLGPAPAPRRRPVRAGTDSTPRNMEGASHGR
jgi:selenocysteine lyase/cysteine desulfurase